MQSSCVLRKIRRKRFVSQYNLARRLGMCPELYKLCENNLVQCELNFVLKILSTLYADDSEIKEFLNAFKQDYMSYMLIGVCNGLY